MDKGTEGAENKARSVEPEIHGNPRLLAKELGIPDLAGRLLYSRGIFDPDNADKFLYPKLKDLSDPFLLPDIDEGVGRVEEASG